MSDLAQAFMSSQVRLTPEQRRQQMCELLRNKGIICRDFLLTGACPHAPMCPYMHIRDGETRAVPWKVCSFYNNSKCLRDRCSFFHGTQADLDALHASGAEVYRPQDYMRVDVPPTEYFVDHGSIVGNTTLLLPVTHTGAPIPTTTTTPTVQFGRKHEGNCSSSGSGSCHGNQLYSLRGGNSGTRNSNTSNNNNSSNKSNNNMSIVSDIKASALNMALAPSTAASAPAAQVRYHGIASSSSTSSVAASHGYGASVTLAPVASAASPSASLSSLSLVQQQQAQQQQAQQQQAQQQQVQQQHTFASFQTYSSATTNSTATSSASPATTSVATTTAYEPIMLLSPPANTTMASMLDTMASPVTTLSSFGPYSYMQSQPPGAFFAAANTSPMSLQQQAQQAQQQHVFSPTQALAMPITAQPSQPPPQQQQQQQQRQQLQPSPFQLQSVAPQGCYYPTQLNTLYIHF